MSTYSFLDTVASLTSADATIDLGYGAAVAEEGLTFARAGDKNSMIIGADGEGMHSLHADKSGTITVRLLKTSPNNAKLMNLYNLQAGNSKKWGKNTITFNHAGSGDNGTGTRCAFRKVPDLKYAKAADVLEWVFDVIKLDTKLGEYE